MIFDYPAVPHERRHGPAGYSSYERCRPWLRDEFDFRCIYCLKRETWGQITGEFELDHFEPQSVNPQRQLDYLNLVYACRRCNLAKLDQIVDDPLQLLHVANLTARLDGSLHPQDIATTRLIRQLDLNSPQLKKWRVMWMRTVALAQNSDSDLYRQLIGFPVDLPDLSKLRPPRNHSITGLEHCWFARRKRGELPGEY